MDRCGSGRIVAMDDDPLTLRLLSAHLQKAGHAIETAASGTGGLELIDESTAVALVDLRMPELDGFQVLQQIQQHYPTVQVIVLTGSEEVSDAVQAMREGAFQYVTKPFDPAQLVVYVEKAIASWQVADENRDLKESHSHNLPVPVMKASGDMQSRLMQQVTHIASLDSTVFIGGETGTGKSTIARMIHQQSKRAKSPFVTVNCASLPRDLIQSELFGHTKGSFTGAVKDRIGHAEVADGGTLFLDEIGDLPIDLQPKLLTFLQDRTVQRLGATDTKQVDVRLIAATHRDLAEMCREGLFRQDLYFRLMVLNLELPALRFRSGEFPNIALGILSAICERQSIAAKTLTDSSMQMLLSHSWPGNIRELENVLERAVAFAAGIAIEPKDLLFSNVTLDHRLQQRDPMPAAMPAPMPSESIPIRDSSWPASSVDRTQEIAKPATQATYSLVGKTLEEIEREAIIQTLASVGGNKAKTARTLGISEKSIYNKMRRLNITR
jgi:DNA-binding NtrC family response regulator